MADLVIVESPAKAKTIEKYLGKGFTVKASMGHLRDLPKKKIGIEIDNDFKPLYQAIDGKDKVINELREYADNSDMIYLATDPDREGEAISWHLKELLFLGDGRTRRVTFNEITKTAVLAAMENPRQIDQELVDAQQARRLLDRIVGYKLSPFLWKKVRRGLSAGRVQSVATRMVVDKEREIEAFKPEEYWSIDAKFSPLKGKATFDASFYGDASGKKELKTKEECDKVLESVDGKEFTVTALKKGTKKKSPPPPFTTSSLQQEASRKLNMTPKKTMSVAQELYEGVNIDGLGLTGLITYMRTDSLRISDEAVASAKSYIEERFGKEYYPAKTRVFKSRGSAQDAHEAIRPSDTHLDPDRLAKSLSRDQMRLYKLIWSRFVACQMKEALMDTVSADISASDYVFRATGFKMKFPGYTAVYNEDEEKGKSLPAFEQGDSMKLHEIVPNQHFTQPPARYTEATLIKAMEEKGVGRPSTYAPTISTILDREYVEKEKKNLKPTPLGEGVTDLMVERFRDIVDVKFTAKMEDRLDDIEKGQATYPEVLSEFYDGLAKNLEKAEKEMDKQKVKIKEVETDVICENCGKNMVIKYGRFGKFLACPSYPDCNFTKPIVDEAGVDCPLCGNKVLNKKSKRGFGYLGCEKNPTCTFMSWDKVTKEVCPDCGATLFRHYDRETKKTSLVCLKPDCSYEKEIPKGKKNEKN